MDACWRVVESSFRGAAVGGVGTLVLAGAVSAALAASGRRLLISRAATEAASGAARVAALAGVFSGVRTAADCALSGGSGGSVGGAPPLLPSLIAGAASVALPTAAVPARASALRGQLSSLAAAATRGDRRVAVGTAAAVAVSAVSGAVVLGGTDYAVRLAGVAWS